MPRGTDLYDEARLQGRLWTPALLRGAGKLASWLDASDLSTITIATGVSAWADKSGNGRGVTQGTGGNQPVYRGVGGAAPMGYPALQFDGANDSLSFASIGATGWTALECFYVADGNNDPGDASGLGGIVCGFGQFIAEAEPYTDGNVYTAFGTSARKNFNPTPALDVKRIFWQRSAPSDFQYWLDGASVFTTGSNTVELGIGPNLGAGGVGFWEGFFHEFLLINTTTSPAEKQTIEGYLAWKWGHVANLPASHVRKRRPPLIGD